MPRRSSMHSSTMRWAAASTAPHCRRASRSSSSDHADVSVSSSIAWALSGSRNRLSGRSGWRTRSESVMSIARSRSCLPCCVIGILTRFIRPVYPVPGVGTLPVHRPRRSRVGGPDCAESDVPAMTGLASYSVCVSPSLAHCHLSTARHGVIRVNLDGHVIRLTQSRWHLRWWGRVSRLPSGMWSVEWDGAMPERTTFWPEVLG